MEPEKVYAMGFARVFSCLIAKAERKGKTREDVLQLTARLTGYPAQELEEMLNTDITYGDFFRRAPAMNPARENIRGSICGVKIEAISEPLMQDIRRLDRLIDELAKGKSAEQIQEKYEL